MIIAQSTRPSSSPVTVTLKRLVALLEEDESDEYGTLRPTQTAFTVAMRFILEAYDVLGDRFPKASASTDEEGGIRLIWSRLEPECEVRLVCPAHQPAYLYHELGDEYAVEREVTVVVLCQWLERKSQVVWQPN
jgi:hypothetical protein